MSTSYYAKFVKCPYYHEDDTFSIMCEGARRTSVIRQTFKSKKEKMNWQNKYCNEMQGYKNCPVYCVACKKYKKEDV